MEKFCEIERIGQLFSVLLNNILKLMLVILNPIRKGVVMRLQGHFAMFLGFHVWQCGAAIANLQVGLGC